MVAAEHGNKKIVELLVEYGADINRADNYGWTALSHGLENGHNEIVKLLLANGAQVNQANNCRIRRW